MIEKQAWVWTFRGLIFLFRDASNASQGGPNSAPLCPNTEGVLGRRLRWYMYANCISPKNDLDWARGSHGLIIPATPRSSNNAVYDHYLNWLGLSQANVAGTILLTSSHI